MIEFDETKRQKCLKERGLDFKDAQEVFDGIHRTLEDTRQDYPEKRFITAGYLNERFVVLCWCWRGKNRRIISMRYGHDKEHRKWKESLG